VGSIFDTANVYNNGESERITGMFLKESNLREQVVLATKVHGKVGNLPNEGGTTRYHILKACEDSLQRLQTDHMDLYQLHRPPLSHPQDETLRAFDDLIHAGKVRYIGCSTHPAWMVMESLAISERFRLNRYISEQPPYNLLDRRIENELVPLCQKYSLAIIPWSPLAMGVLAGRYTQAGHYPDGSRVQHWDK
jgi:1-deoxyxylulose-5-phosphate synthase